MQGISDLFGSERGTFCIVLVVVSGVLVGFGSITSEAWIDYTKWIATVLVASKTVTSAIETAKAPAPSGAQMAAAKVVEKE